MNPQPNVILLVRLTAPHSVEPCLSWLKQSENPTFICCTADSDPRALELFQDFLAAEARCCSSLAELATWGDTTPQQYALYFQRDSESDTAMCTSLLTHASTSAHSPTLPTTLMFWLDTPGPHRANPKLVPHAEPITELSFEEARELFSSPIAEVFDSLTIETLSQAEAAAIPLMLIGIRDGRISTTLISSEASADEFGVRALVCRESIALLTVEPSFPEAGNKALGALLSSLADAAVEIQFIASSVADITGTLGLQGGSIEQVQEILTEYETQFDFSYAEQRYSVIGIVGTHMRNRAGVSGKVFNTLAKNGISVAAIAQSSSELAISIVIRSEDTAKALRALHDSLFLGARNKVQVVLLGPGAIGSEVHRQIEEHSKRQPKPRSTISVVAVSNRSRALFDVHGISPDAWTNAAADTGDHHSISETLDACIQMNLSNCIVIDATASDEVPAHYGRLLQHSISVVTPNKKGLCLPHTRYTELQRLARRHNAKWYYETTVGAGLPVIGTLHDLIASGDSIVSIEAVLSGTLSYLWNTYSSECSFAELVKQAQAQGITEPDPRDDLNGLDVGRKLLILARECGYSFELEDIQISPCIPEHCLHTETVNSFYRALSEAESEIANRYQEAVSRNEVLRYIARLDHNGAHVALCSVDASHPFYRLAGTDNILSITTERYSAQPLVIRGPGAGVAVTAAGVLADVLRVANYLE